MKNYRELGNFFQIFALALATACAVAHGYNGYNDHHSYNNYGSYNNYDSYNSYGSYNGHRLHKRTVFLPPFLATKGLLALAKVPFPIG